MKGEIRGLPAGDYWNDESDCAMIVYRDDEGTHLVNVDIDTEWAYHWIISPEGKVEKFEASSAFFFNSQSEGE